MHAFVPKIDDMYLKYEDEYLTETYAYKVSVSGQRWVNLDHEFSYLALKQADIQIFQKNFRKGCTYLCQANCVENEKHFLFHCSFYSHLTDKVI